MVSPIFEKPYIYMCVCDISQLQRQSILPYSLLYVVIIFVEIGTSKKYGRSYTVVSNLFGLVPPPAHTPHLPWFIISTSIQWSNLPRPSSIPTWRAGKLSNAVNASHVEKCDFQWPLIPIIQALAFRHPIWQWKVTMLTCDLPIEIGWINAVHWSFGCSSQHRILGGTPHVYCWHLWKMMEFVSWDHYSQYMEKWKMFQTTNQYCFLGGDRCGW